METSEISTAKRRSADRRGERLESVRIRAVDHGILGSFFVKMKVGGSNKFKAVCKLCTMHTDRKDGKMLDHISTCGGFVAIPDHVKFLRFWGTCQEVTTAAPEISGQFTDIGACIHCTQVLSDDNGQLAGQADHLISCSNFQSAAQDDSHEQVKATLIRWQTSNLAEFPPMPTALPDIPDAYSSADAPIARPGPFTLPDFLQGLTSTDVAYTRNHLADLSSPSVPTAAGATSLFSVPTTGNPAAPSTNPILRRAQPRTASPQPLQDWPKDGKISKDDTALLIVAMARDYCDPDGAFDLTPYAPQRPYIQKTLIPNIESTLLACRAAGLTIVHCMPCSTQLSISHDEHVVPGPKKRPFHFTQEMTEEILRDRNAITEINIVGSQPDPSRLGMLFCRLCPGQQSVKKLEPLPGEPTVSYGLSAIFDNASVFKYTDLHQNLQQRGIKKLLIAGINIDNCIRDTARDAATVLHPHYEVCLPISDSAPKALGPWAKDVPVNQKGDAVALDFTLPQYRLRGYEDPFRQTVVPRSDWTHFLPSAAVRDHLWAQATWTPYPIRSYGGPPPLNPMNHSPLEDVRLYRFDCGNAERPWYDVPPHQRTAEHLAQQQNQLP